MTKYKDNRLIGVIIPAYNAQNTIERALRSVIRQDYDEWELIVVDDGSDDDTLQIVEDIKRSDLRISLLRKEHTGIVAYVRNQGIKALDGVDYYAFLDADDEWLPEKLRLQKELMESQVDCLMSCTRCIIRTEDKSKSDRYSRSLPATIKHWTLLFYNPVVTSTVMTKASAIKQSGGFDERPALNAIEDRELWLRLGARGLICSLNKVQTIHYLSSKSLRHKVDDLKSIDVQFESWKEKGFVDPRILPFARITTKMLNVGYRSIRRIK